MTIRILIADDHPLFRDGLHGLLDSLTDTEVVGEAATVEEVIARAATLQPDVILMDIRSSIRRFTLILHANLRTGTNLALKSVRSFA